MGCNKAPKAVTWECSKSCPLAPEHRKSSERLIYVQLTSCVCWKVVEIKKSKYSQSHQAHHWLFHPFYHLYVTIKSCVWKMFLKSILNLLYYVKTIKNNFLMFVTLLDCKSTYQSTITFMWIARNSNKHITTACSVDKILGINVGIFRFPAD